MDSHRFIMLATVILIAALSGCHTVQQESALQWMQRQPWILDP